MTEAVVKFVASVLGVQPSQDELSTPPMHVGSTCQAIAARSSQPENYLGESVGPQAEILQWLNWAGSELNPLLDDKLLKVNAHLETRTFLAGSTLTLADLVIFGVSFPATVRSTVQLPRITSQWLYFAAAMNRTQFQSSFPVAQYNHFCNLLRWADHIQSLVGADKVAAHFQRGPLKVYKPLFVAPPPPAPAPAAAAAPAKGAAADASKASTSKAGPAEQPAAAPAGGGKAKPAAAAADAGAKKGAAAPAPAAAAPAAAQAKDASAKQEGGKKEAKKEAAAKPADKGGDEDVRIDMLDIRVGQIVKVGKHPNADALYLEEIDVGEAQPRQVISGLVKFVPIEEMQNRRVLVVLNLKPAKMRDVMSYGMVLCSSTEEHDKVVPCAPPDGVPVGERVVVEGFDQEPLAEVNPKKKILERLFPDMKTNADGVPCYKGLPFTTSKGSATSPLPNAWVR